MWILKTCAAKREALYWELFFSHAYGIPTLVFLTGGRKMTITQKDIDALFREINTTERVQSLFRDTGLDFEYPHYFPQGTTHADETRGRLNIKVNMFGDRRKSALHPWGMSRISINATSPDFRRDLETAGFRTRKGKRTDWRLEIARLDYGKIEKLVEKISALHPHLVVVKGAFLTKHKKTLFQPAANIMPGMKICLERNGEIIEDAVVSVEKRQYEGEVYDLNVASIHNYIANNIAVHNCIYGWRGASMRNILNFEKDYVRAKVVLLEENYRSTQTILAAANQIIKKNRLRREKTLFTKNSEGERLGLYAASDEADEAAFIARKSKELTEQGVSPSEIAVLFRANFQSRALEEAFLNAAVPYQVLGLRFFERKEVKDMLSYARAALNPASRSDLRRIINVPPRGVGKVTLLKIFAGKEKELPAAAQGKIAAFRKLLAELKKKLETERLSAALKWVVTESGLEKTLKDGDAEDRERLENIKELVTFATRYDYEPDRAAAVGQFLADAALQSDQDELQEERDAVRLMTVHASKGLEFEHVFIAGLEEGLFPHARTTFAEPARQSGAQNLNERVRADETLDEDASEEERRLFYVALTRAKKRAYLSYAGVRTVFGARAVNLPSEFIFDIPEEFLQTEQCEYPNGRINE